MYSAPAAAATAIGSGIFKPHRNTDCMGFTFYVLIAEKHDFDLELSYDVTARRARAGTNYVISLSWHGCVSTSDKNK